MTTFVYVVYLNMLLFFFALASLVIAVQLTREDLEKGVVNRQTRFFQPSSCLQIKWISPQLLMFKQFAFLVEDGAKLYSSYSSLLLHVIRFWGFRASLQKELIGEQVRFAATRLTLISFTLKSWNCLSEKYRHRSAEIWTLHRFTSFSIVLSTFATCCIRHR